MFLAYVVYLIVNYVYRSDKYIPTILAITMLFVYKVFNKQAWKFLYTASNFRQGLDGEALVAEELKKLPDEYIVIQDVKIPNMKSNIDFVVLSANGIFALEVKSHEGNITYNGKELLRNGYALEKNFLWQVRSEATSLTEYLQANIDRNLYVNALLVFSSSKAKMRFGESPVVGVVIIGRAWLMKHITSRATPNSLKPEHIEQIARLFHATG